MLARVLPLFAIIGLGVLAGRAGLFPDLGRAITVLNRFALYVAFPLLVVASLADPGVDLTGSVGFYAAHLVALFGQLAFLAVLGRLLRLAGPERSALALSGFFGNIAYLGIPFCISAFGPEVAGLAALSAAVHLAFAMTGGPILLAPHSERSVAGAGLMREVVRQPLVWSPVLGLLLRLGPMDVVAPLLAVAGPVGASAGPVALFLLGLYLFANRGELVRPTRATAGLLAAKLVAYPALAWVVALLLAPVLPLTTDEVAVVVLMGGMPVAITTFALAEEFGAGRDVTARGIVLTTVVAMATLPVLAMLLGAK